MSIRTYRAATLALALWAGGVPVLARAAGFGNIPPAVGTLTVSPVPTVAGAAATITCAATDPGSVTELKVTVSGGTLAGGSATALLAITPGPSVTGSITWNVPAQAASLTVSCAAKDNGGSYGVPPATTTRSITVQTEAAAAPPVIAGVAGPTAPVLAGATATFTVNASDPAGGPLTYAWAASGGALQAEGAQATWTAPAVAGAYTITATVRNAAGTAVQASVSAISARALSRGGLSGALVAPRRFAADGAGNVYAADVEAGVLMLSPRGEHRGTVHVGEAPAGLAVAPEGLLVSTVSGRVLVVSLETGRVVRELALEDGPLRGSTALLYEPARGRVWATERAAGRVRVFGLDGRTAFVVAAAGPVRLAGPVDLALDAARARVWVLREIARRSSEVYAGDPPEVGRVVHGYDLDGGYLESRVTVGSASGQVSRAGGIAVGASGELYVADVFQGQVQVFSADGASLGGVGAFGGGAAQLRNPLGVAVLGNGDLLVANLGATKVERYGTGASAPVCEGDADCDGLPDAWEQAHGLDPASASDALLDGDADGLTNLQERVAGTNPGLGDSDGDGVPDAAELAAGTDPLDPADPPDTTDPTDPPPRAELAVAAPAESGPGLIELAATATGPGACAVTWTQRQGPVVALREAGGLRPSYVARTPGTYRFEAIARCGALTSPPVTASTVVRDVAPVAEAGGIRVVRPVSQLALEGSATDANGQPTSLAWDQLLGVPLAGATASADLVLRPRAAGYYVFQLTARDGAGGEGTAEVPVLVVSDVAPTAFVSSPLQAAVGEEVTLDASPSHLTTDVAEFSWRQVEGPTVALAAADGLARFTPATPGRYVFEVAVIEPGVRSPPARVDVYVAGGEGRLPAAVAASFVRASPGAIVRLDGSLSEPATAGAELSYTWRQVAGPAAGLTGESSAVANVVPFSPGTHEFELSVREGAAEGLPARVRVEVAPAGAALPVARAAGPGLAVAGDLVVLDGRESSRASRHAWTQTAGPWVPIRNADREVARFQPPVPGLYTFELVVGDGELRSAPAVVSVLVFGTVEAAR